VNTCPEQLKQCIIKILNNIVASHYTSNGGLLLYDGEIERLVCYLLYCGRDAALVWTKCRQLLPSTGAPLTTIMKTIFKFACLVKLSSCAT